MRSCVTAEATAIVQARVNALLTIKNKFDVCLLEKKTDYALVMQYERERKRILSESTPEQTTIIADAMQHIHNDISKLQLIRQVHQLCN